MNELRFSKRNQAFSATQLESLFSRNLKTQNAIKIGKRLISLHTLDVQNRLLLQTSQPVYGSDCIRAMEIELVMSNISSNKPRLSFSIDDLAMP